MDVLVNDDQRHGIGGNNPPDPIEILRGQLVETHSALIARCKTLLDMEARLPGAMDDDWEAKISEAIKSCTKFSRNSEVTRLDANEPHRALIAATDAFFKAMSDKVDALKTKMTKDFLTPYQQAKADAEKRRLEEEAREAKARADEAARLAREEAARLAEAKRIEEAAKADAERRKRERIEAEEKRKREKIEAEEKAERDRQDAIRLEAEAKNKKQRAAAAAALEKTEREAREREEAAAAEAREQRARDKTAREEAAAAEAKAKADRKEQERSAAEARDAAAAAERLNNKAGRAVKASSAELSRTRTDLGAVASLRTTWHHEVTDATLVPRIYLSVNDGAIAAAIEAATKDGKCELTIKGVRIYPMTDSVVR